MSKWAQPLAKPGVHEPDSRTCGADRYTVTLSAFYHQFHPDLKSTKVYGYNGKYPGDSFEARVGRPVEVLWKNELPPNHILPTVPLEGPETPPESAAVVHLHGGHTPADSDGHPLDWIVTGDSQRFYYPNIQPATTLWYHDHIWTRTRANVYAGLAGFYLLRDENEAKLRLPSGEFEIPMAFQDRVIVEGDDQHTQLFYPFEWQPEFFGDVGVVNGRAWPFADVKPRAYRFRLLNGCNSRFLRLSIRDGANPGPKFQQIGTDGGFMNAPAELEYLILGPGERADVIVDFHGFEGKELIVSNDAPAPFPNGMMGTPEIPEFLQFRVALTGGSKRAYKIPCLRKAADLPENPRKLNYPFKIAKVRYLTLEEIALPDGTVIPTLTGRRFTDPPTETPLVDTVELWHLINLTPDTHPIHLHLTQFRLIGRRSFETDPATGDITSVGSLVPPDANELGYKDTIRANPAQITTILAPFEDFTGDYVWHCHILEHEDFDMMRPLVVLPRPKEHDCDHD